MAAFTLAHLSDPHLPPLPAARLRDLAGKRALGYLNWTRNRHKYHRRDVLDALVRLAGATARPHRGNRRSRQSGAGGRVHAGGDWLESLGAPQHVTVIPGNHDAMCAPQDSALPGPSQRICAATPRLA